MTESRAEVVVEGIYKDMERRIAASPPGLCPVDLTWAFLKMCHAQTCGKCVPCRVGLSQLSYMLEDVMKNRASSYTLERIESLATVIAESADCAIGAEAAKMVLKGLGGFRSDYVSHIKEHHCSSSVPQSIPCVANCPAGVDIPGYVALVGEERYADAVRLIRKDNPFPTVCALVCEHPCEAHCRRTLLDAPVNIRGLKRSAVDRAGVVPAPDCMPKTGKRIAIIGGGPSGLSAAFYLQLMGHQCTVFEKHKHLGGMLIYGIPAYRLPRERLQEDIDCILSTGVEVKLNTEVGKGEYTMDRLREEYDAVYISIGAHTDKKVGVEGEDAENVLSAVEFLGKIGDNDIPDFTGKKVAIIGGGNVAMDCTRSAIRCGAESVSIVYRRRKEDMTALVEEVDGAIAEGAIMMDLHAPLRIEKDETGKVAALWATPNMPGQIKGDRMNPTASGVPDKRIPCDVIIVAVGQGIDFHHLEDSGIPVLKGVIKAANWTAIENAPGVFAGGDCVTGPKTAIRAIAAGKVAAANIDYYLGYNHIITSNVKIPTPSLNDRPYCGRINMTEREPGIRKNDFELMEIVMTEKESCQEAGRCLRCDHFGCGSFKGGRKTEW
jgi:NADPH-dependent glutamate synthase beta subunit-like oxidoreductase